MTSCSTPGCRPIPPWSGPMMQAIYGHRNGGPPREPDDHQPRTRRHPGARDVQRVRHDSPPPGRNRTSHHRGERTPAAATAPPDRDGCRPPRRPNPPAGQGSSPPGSPACHRRRRALLIQGSVTAVERRGRRRRRGQIRACGVGQLDIAGDLMRGGSGEDSNTQLSQYMHNNRRLVGVGALRLLEAIRDHNQRHGRSVRYYQAGSSEMFGKVR